MEYFVFRKAGAEPKERPRGFGSVGAASFLGAASDRWTCLCGYPWRQQVSNQRRRNTLAVLGKIAWNYCSIFDR